MKLYETAYPRPSALRLLLYRMRRERLSSKMQKAETEEERAKLIEELCKLDTMLSGDYEVR